MAKRKKRKKTTTRRRRGRVGSTASDRAMGALLVMGGAALSRTIDAILPDDMDVDPRLIAGGKMAIGVFAPTFFKDAKTRKIAEQVGDGLLAVSSMEMLDAFGFFEGVGLPKMSKNLIAQADDVEELAVVLEGYDELNEDVLAEDVLADDVINQGIDVISGDNYDDIYDDDDDDDDDLMMD